MRRRRFLLHAIYGDKVKRSVQVETKEALRYGGIDRNRFSVNRAEKCKKGRRSSGGDSGGGDSDESEGEAIQ